MSQTEGKTAEISIEQARKLFRSIGTGSVIGLRDRAVLGVLAYTGARVGAVARLNLSDYRDTGEQRALHRRSFPESFSLPLMALRTALSALSHFVCSVVPGAADQLFNVASQSCLDALTAI
jgi:hypothetical protein